MAAIPSAPNDILRVIEVADTSLAYDRGRKVAAYAGSGIPEYWIVNLADCRIEVFSDPDSAITSNNLTLITELAGQKPLAIVSHFSNK